jgi:hypothetical protein
MFLNQNLHFSLMKLGSIWVVVSILKTTGIGTVLIQDRLLKWPFIITRLVYSISLLLYELQHPHSFTTLLFKGKRKTFWASTVMVSLLSNLGMAFTLQMHVFIH